MGVINNNKVISTTQNKKLKPSNFINICPLCWNIPTINILYDQPYKIHLHCNKCFHDETLPLINFLEQLEKTKVEIAKRKNIKAKTRNVKSEMNFLPRYARMFCIDYESQNNNVPDEEEEIEKTMNPVNQFCPLHPERENFFFCLDCREHFCKSCYDKHHTHIHCKLDNYVSPPVIDKIITNVGRAEFHLKEYNEKLKIEIVNKLKKQIERIEIAYTLNNRINENLIKLINILISDASYNIPNFYSYENLINHSNFNYDTPIKVSSLSNPMVNINDIIHYYNSNFIITESNKKIPFVDGTLFSIDLSKMTLIQRIKEHKHHINCLLALNDGRFASCSNDCLIKIFKVVHSNQTFTCSMIIDNHKNFVNYLCELENSTIASCSADKTIRIFKLSKTNYQVLAIIEAHKGNIWKLEALSDCRIASCSFDHTVKIWNVKTYKLIVTLEGHKKPIYSILKLQSGNLVSGTFEEDTLRFWSTMNYKCNAVVSKVQCFQNNSLCEIRKNVIAVGGLNCISVVNCKSYQIEGKIMNASFSYVEMIMKMKDGNLLCGNQEGDIVVINSKSCKVVYLREGIHKGSVNTIISLGQRYLATGSHDCWINIWKY